MQTRIIGLLMILILTFSAPVSSQTTTQSKHPKLDAYYRSNQNADTSKVLNTEVKSAPETKQIPIVSTKPEVTPSAVITNTTVPAPITPQPVSSTATVKPVSVPVVTKIRSTAPPSPYLDTRTGSSTSQYNTWDKNNNGAGSVTTSPK